MRFSSHESRSAGRLAAVATIFGEMPRTLHRGAFGAGLASVALCAAVLIALGSGPAGTPLGPAQAEARCGEPLAATYSVQSRYPKLYASQYKKRVKVNVTTNHGPLVEWQVQLYTFQGKLLGQTNRKRALNRSDTVRVDLKFPLQPGKFTIVIKGYPRGCRAESQMADVVRFSDCTDRLPVKFPDMPGGVAADYEGFLSIPVESRGGALIKDPRTEIYSFSNEFFGRDIDEYPRLFGRLTFNNKLVKPLRAGSYTVIVSGRLDQPRECGSKDAQATLTFT